MLLALPLFAAPAHADVTISSALKAVDKAWNSDQLNRIRKQDPASTDACTDIKGQKTFADAVEFGIDQGLKSRIYDMNSVVRRAFSLKDIEEQVPVGLISHPYCQITKESALHILGETRMPDDATLAKLNKYVSRLNRTRAEMAKGVEGSRAKMKAYMGLLMGCLSYEESLAAPGDDGSIKERYDEAFREVSTKMPNLTKRYTNKDGVLQRPSGVCVYTDHDGGYVLELRALKAAGKWDAEAKKALDKKYPSWITIGLFQMSAILYGNIDPCVDAWNAERPACPIAKRSEEGLALGLVSSGQTFNSFCGVQKVVHAFHSQVHSNAPTGTDIANINQDGTLKDSKDRCVNLLSRGGKDRIYSHFGPLGNSVKTNLPSVVSCIDKGLTTIEAPAQK